MFRHTKLHALFQRQPIAVCLLLAAVSIILSVAGLFSLADLQTQYGMFGSVTFPYEALLALFSLPYMFGFALLNEGVLRRVFDLDRRYKTRFCTWVLFGDRF